MSRRNCWRKVFDVGFVIDHKDIGAQFLCLSKHNFRMISIHIARRVPHRSHYVRGEMNAVHCAFAISLIATPNASNTLPGMPPHCACPDEIA
jgi:hypothetical protein